MTAPDFNAVVLPALPKTDYVIGIEGDGYSEDRLLSCPGYTDDEMHDYATAAVLADRERRAPAAPVVAGTLRKALADLLTANAHNASCQAGIASNCICVACATARARAALSAPVGAAPDVPSPPPLFASSVARRKWESLQADGYRMQSITFEREGRRGWIDPWGTVMWAQVASTIDAAAGT